MIQDLTKTHSIQFVDSEGRKHVVIKPIKIIKTPNAKGGVDVTIVVPRLAMKARKT